MKLIEITNIVMYIEKKTKDQPWVLQQVGWKQRREAAKDTKEKSLRLGKCQKCVCLPRQMKKMFHGGKSDQLNKILLIGQIR